MSSTLETGLWKKVTDDVTAAISRRIGYAKAIGVNANGRVRVRSFDPEVTGEREVRKLRGVPVSSGDGVITIKLPGLFEVAIGAILKDGEPDTGLGGDFVPEHTHPKDLVWDQKTTVAATVASTTDTVNYQEAIALSLALPAGTWKVSVIAQGNFSHSASGLMRRGIEIDGTVLGAGTLTLTTARETYPTEVERSGVAGDRSILCRLLYNSSAAGTTGCRAPSIQIFAEREA